MAENQPIHNYSELEDKLSRLYQAPSPPAAFAERLERRLLAGMEVGGETVAGRIPIVQRVPQALRGLLRRPAWAISLAVVVVMLTFVGVNGPQRTLAQVQRLVGYIPGVGFVDLDKARVLAVPVEDTQKGVTMRVEQVVADPSGTEVILTMPGLREEDLSLNDFNGEEGRGLQVSFHLKDGRELQPKSWEMTAGRAHVQFPPLPEDEYQVELVISALPFVPSEARHGEWRFMLPLRPALGEWGAELFPEPYTPAGAKDTQQGVTVEVLRVVHALDETAVQLGLTWGEEGWDSSGCAGSLILVRMRDDVGHVYHQQVQEGSVKAVGVEKAVEESPATASLTPTLKPNTIRSTVHLSPLSLAAQQVELSIDAVDFEFSTQKRFVFDLGKNPQLGQIWELDKWVNIAGVRTHIVQAALMEDTTTRPERQQPYYSLQFQMETDPESPVKLSHISTYNPTPGFRGGGSSSLDPGSYQVSLVFEEIPEGSLEIQMGGGISVQGPWEISWPVPAGEKKHATVRHFYPEHAQDTQHGLTLEVDEVVASDRLTAVQVSAKDLPNDMQLLHLLMRDLEDWRRGADPDGLYLETPRGERLGWTREVSWQPAGDTGAGDGWQTFAPLPPLMERVRLRVPAGEFFKPDQATLEVSVPEGVVFHKETYEAQVYYGGRVETEEDTRWVSDPWQVDIPVDIAGVQLHFTQALVRRVDYAEGRYQLVLSGEFISSAQGQAAAGRFHFSSITKPDGSTDTAGPYTSPESWHKLGFGGFGCIVSEHENLKEAEIRLDVTKENGVELLPGRYQLVLDGVGLWVPGPWEIDFSLAPD
ncbi:MAG: hypothetical protein R6U57_13030 [Anaerolineales bacterium]